MEKYLIKEIKKMEGSLVGVGIDNEKIKDEIEKNNNITTCYLLEDTFSNKSKKKLNLFNKNKKVNIKKIKKVFKKKKIDNVISNYSIIKPFLKTFVRDSVYINKKTLYIYGTKEDYDEIIERYKRYTDKIEIKKEKNYFIIKIDNTNTKNNKIKDIGYWWVDTFNQFADYLTSILVN